MKLEGIDQLTENLKKALLQHSEVKVRKAMRRGAQLIVDEAKSIVVEKTGLLKKSIQIMPKWRGDPMGTYVGPRIKKSRKKKPDAAVLTPFYAAWIEYGTAKHNLGYKGKYVSGKGADHPGSKPKPYMRPAYDAKAQSALKVAMEDVEKMVMNG